MCCVGGEFSATIRCGGIICYFKMEHYTFIIIVLLSSVQEWFVEKLPGIIKWKKKRIDEKAHQRHFHTKAPSFCCPARAMQNWSWVLSSLYNLPDRGILRNLLTSKHRGYIEVKCRGKGCGLVT